MPRYSGGDGCACWPVAGLTVVYMPLSCWKLQGMQRFIQTTRTEVPRDV